MKKLLALTVALCLFCVSCAFAESILSDGTPLQFDDFTLKLEAGMIYEPGEKGANQVLLQAYPFAASNNTGSNFNIGTTGIQGNYTTDMVNAAVEFRKQSLLDSFASIGFTINSLEYKDAAECTLSGLPGVLVDSVTSYSYSDISGIFFTRRIYVNGNAYLITLTASVEEDIEKMTELLDAILTWN